jgi:hypothetical protein
LLPFFAFIEWDPKEVKKLVLLPVFNETTTTTTTTTTVVTTTTKRVKGMEEDLETLSSD